MYFDVKFFAKCETIWQNEEEISHEFHESHELFLFLFVLICVRSWQKSLCDKIVFFQL